MMRIQWKTRIRGYIRLIRPFTLLAPLIVSLCIMMASYVYNGRTDDLSLILWTTILPASVTLASINAASNALNQATDVETDKISKPYRPIIQGMVTAREAQTVSFILYFFALSLSIFINFVFSILVLLIMGFTVTYSLPPRMKDQLFLNQLWVAVPRGLLGILASWSVFGTAFHPVPLTIGLIAMCFLIGGSITKDITDINADKKTGTCTLVNTYGIKKSALISLPFMFFPFVMIPLLIEAGILDSYLWLLTFLAIPGYLIFYLMIREEPKSKFLENTPAWVLMYVTYLVFASSFSVLTILGSVFA